MLKLFNINDDQVKLFEQNYFTQIILMLYSLIRLLFSLVFTLPGNIMLFPLSTAIAYYAENERIKALKKSSVKIKGNDVLATIKLTAYIATLPVYLFIFTILFNLYINAYTDLAVGQTRLYTLIFFFAFPVIQVISIRSHDGVRTHYTQF